MTSACDRVTVVIKASNQQYEDQMVDCESNWSVKQLKEHLHEVYPCKPNVDEQKLIYAGQLLSDKLLLKEILRTYEGVSPPNHTIHLVSASKLRLHNKPTKTTGSDQRVNIATDGIRHRSSATPQATTSNATPSSFQPTPQISRSNPVNVCLNPCALVNGNVPDTTSFRNNTGDSLFAQQLAMQTWMQQAYAQYFNQYMNLLSNGVRPETLYMPSQSTTSIPQFAMPVQSLTPDNFNSLSSNNRVNSSATIPETTIVPNSEVANTEASPAVEQPEAAVQNDQPQPRFPNIVQEELPENRDWLDMFYSFSRLLVLLTLVYFYSSPLRCLVVFIIGVAIYLYHVGFFRQVGEANNNNNILLGGDNVQQQEQGAAATPQPIDNADNNAGDDNQARGGTGDTSAIFDGEVDVSSNPLPGSPNNGTSVIAFIRTFVVSFFVSLLPEPPGI